MLKVETKGESPYLYRMGMEIFGKSIEFAISHKELAALKNKSAGFIPQMGWLRTYFKATRAKTAPKRATAKVSTAEL